MEDFSSRGNHLVVKGSLELKYETVLSVLQKAEKEMHADKRYLSDERTVFKLTRKAKQFSFGDDSKLDTFFRASARLLLTGASSKEIASQLKIRVAITQFYLNKLRTTRLHKSYPSIRRGKQRNAR